MLCGVGGGRDTPNVFSASVLFVLTLSKCVCCRLGEMTIGQGWCTACLGLRFCATHTQWEECCCFLLGCVCVCGVIIFALVEEEEGGWVVRGGVGRWACPFV